MDFLDALITAEFLVYLYTSLAIGLGVILSLIHFIFRATNLAKVPMRLVFLKALPGNILYIAIWTLFSIFLYGFILKHVNFIESVVYMKFSAPIIFGYILPQFNNLHRLNLPIKDNIASKIFLNKIVPILNLLFEQTVGNWARITSRELRNVSHDYSIDRYKIVIDVLFEHHLVSIAGFIHKNLGNRYNGNPLEVIKNIKGRTIKLNYLLMFLGYSQFISTIEKFHVNPQEINPHWPIGQIDRRVDSRRKRSVKTVPDLRKNLSQRRVDQPYSETEILHDIVSHSK